MKKIISVILCLVMAFVLVGCDMNVSDVMETERKETEETIQIEQTEQTKQTEQTEPAEQTEQPIAEVQNVPEEENTETPEKPAKEKPQSITQAEFYWKVKPIDGDDEEVCLTAEESKMVYDFISGCKYELGTADCLNDFAFVRDDGSVIYYHSDCGTFNDNANELSYRTLDWQKEKVSELLFAIFGYVSGSSGENMEICDGVPLAPEGFEKP